MVKPSWPGADPGASGASWGLQPCLCQGCLLPAPEQTLLLGLHKPQGQEGQPGDVLVPAALLRCWHRHCWGISSLSCPAGNSTRKFERWRKLILQGRNPFGCVGAVPPETDAVHTAAGMESLHFGLFALVAIIYYTHRGTHWNRIIQVELKHLKTRKYQELGCWWSSISFLLFIHYGRVIIT